MSCLTFVSGWAGYPQLFAGLNARQFLVPFLDCFPDTLPDKLHNDTSAILAGWSFGAFCILRNLAKLLPKYQKIILFAPFLSFSRWHEKRELDRLTAALATHPQTALNAFWRACGCPLTFRAARTDFPLLREGLARVRKSQANPVACSASNLILAHGEQDTIVPPRSSQELQHLYPKTKTFFLPQTAHWISPQKIHELCHEAPHSKRL